MEISSNYYYCNQDNRIPSSFLQNITNSNCMRVRDKFWNSINNNISTSLSSYDINNEKNICRNQNTRENNFLISSPYFCGCHPNNECIYIPECHCMPIYHCNSHCYTQHSNNLIIKNEEINKNDDKLFNEIFYLKRNLKKVENELNRTKTEKDASDFYIKELEKELSKLNMNNNNKISNINGKESKKRGVNSVKMRDFGKYHDMLNKSFEVLDSVSNKCNDPRGKTKGGVNYYFDKNQDYNIIIDTQKKWIDNLPQYNTNDKIDNNLNEYDRYGSNKFSNSEYPDDNSKLNVFKYPENYININDENNNSSKGKLSNDSNLNNLNNNIPKDNNYLPYNSKDNNNDNLNFDNQGTKIDNNKLGLNNNNSYPNQIRQKINSIMGGKNNYNYPNNNINKSGLNIPKNNDSIKYPKRNNNQRINQNKPSYIPNNRKNESNKIKNKTNGNNDLNNKNSPKKENKKQNKNNDYDALNDRYLVADNQGNPIFIEGNRLLAMKIVPNIGEDGKEELDENGNIIFLGPDGQPKTQDDLEPIILDNDLPLVNEENKPFLGIDGIIMINRYGNPIVGPGELYDKDNQVVHGVLGMIPTDKNGNLIKINNIEQSPINLNNNNFKNDDENNDNNNNDNNNNENNNYGDKNNGNNKNNYDDNNDYDNNGNNNDKNNYNNYDDDNNNKDNNNIDDYGNNNNDYYNDDDNNDDDNNNDNNNNDNNNNDNNNNDNDNDDNNNYNNDYNDNNDDNFNNQNKIPFNKVYNNGPDGGKDNNKKNRANITPLIGSDGRPVRDKNNNPIMLDNNNRPIKGTGISLLLDQKGMPVLNSIGEPILINKEGKPINLIDNKNDDNNMNNPKVFYPNIKQKDNKRNNNKNNKNKNKKNKNEYMNDNKETGKFNNNPFDDENNDYIYPKPNPNYQRKINYKPISNTKFNPQEYLSSCFACDVGCSVSQTGYSPMTYSPYDNRIKRRESTPLKNEIEY